MVHGGGGAPAWLGGGGRADEHQRATGKLTSGSVGAEEGRTRELHDGARAAAMAAGGAQACGERAAAAFARTSSGLGSWPRRRGSGEPGRKESRWGLAGGAPAAASLLGLGSS